MNKKLLLIVIPLLAIIIAALGVLAFLLVDDTSGGNEVYLKQIKSARNCLNVGNTEQAIMYFKSAIQADSTQEDPYIELADVYYTRLGSIEQALDVLRQGYSATGSSRINALIVYYGNLGTETINVEKQIADGSEERKGVLNNTYMDAFATYTFKTYNSRCTVTSEKRNNDVYTVSFAQYSAVMEYRNSNDTPNIVNSSTGTPYDNVRPTLIRLTKLSDFITGIERGVSRDDLVANGAVNVRLNHADSKISSDYLSFEYKNCTILIGCDANGVINDLNAENMVIPPAVTDLGVKYTVSGNIVNSVNNTGVNGATMNFRVGQNKQSGSIEESVSTNVSGSYSVELVPSDYTVEVVLNGFTTEFFEFTLSDSDINLNYSISPVLQAGQIRIVLEWGEVPSDLDSHVYGVTSSNTNFHVYWSDQKYSMDGNVIAELDVDDTSSYGPETITINDTSVDFEYKVHRYSSFGSLASSGAIVKVYTDASSQPVVFTVPNDLNSEWWDVFSYKNGQLIY